MKQKILDIGTGTGEFLRRYQAVSQAVCSDGRLQVSGRRELNPGILDRGVVLTMVWHSETSPMSTLKHR